MNTQRQGRRKFLFFLSASLVLFQIGCKDEDVAKGNVPIATTNVLGGIIVGSGLSVTNNGVLSVNSTPTTTTPPPTTPAPPPIIPQQNKLLRLKWQGRHGFPNNKSIPKFEIYISDYDGNSNTLININLPINESIGGISTISPDRKTFFFYTWIYEKNEKGLYDFTNKAKEYSCSIDGSNLKLINTIDYGNPNDSIYYTVYAY